MAASVGVSNLAASIGIGAGGVTRATRVRVLLTFGLFEAAMPIIGLVIGQSLASDIGRETRLVARTAAGGVGAYGIARFALLRIRGQEQSGERPWLQQRAGEPAAAPTAASPLAPRPVAPPLASPVASQQRLHQWIKIGVSAFALSLDNLIAGFALGSYQMNLITGALVFGVVSIGMSLAGLELGAKLGNWAGDGGELIGGVVLVGVGVAIGTGVLG